VRHFAYLNAVTRIPTPRDALRVRKAKFAARLSVLGGVCAESVACHGDSRLPR
jgi:hypothetical protein